MCGRKMEEKWTERGRCRINRWLSRGFFFGGGGGGGGCSTNGIAEKNSASEVFSV